MTNKRFYDLIRDALECSSEDDFIGSVGYPDWAPDDADRFYADLANIYQVAHMSIREMRAAVHMSQGQLAERFAIPKRTVQNWDVGARECPHYLRIMMADLLGLITVERL